MKEIVFIEQKHMFAKKSAIAEINVDMTEITWQNNDIAIFQKNGLEVKIWRSVIKNYGNYLSIEI